MVGYDCLIESDLEIWGGDPASDDTGIAADINIVSDEMHPAEPADDDVYRWDGATLDFCPPGVARYRCREGNRIEVAALPGADGEEILGLLIATALPALLWMRGAFVLHAAAAIVPGSDRAIAIAGSSGIGKSTIVDQLVRRGGELIADDSVAITFRGDEPFASGLPSGYFLRDQAGGRIFQPVPKGQRRRHAPLAALLFLAHAAHPGFALARLSGLETVTKLLANRHRPRAAEAMQRQVRGLRDCAQIAHRIAAYDWQRSGNEPALAPAEWDALVSLASGGT